MLIQFTEDTRVAGDKKYHKGDEVQLDDTTAEKMVERGHATEIEKEDPLKEKLEDMTKEEIEEEFGVSSNQKKDEMIEEALKDNQVHL